MECDAKAIAFVHNALAQISFLIIEESGVTLGMSAAQYIGLGYLADAHTAAIRCIYISTVPIIQVYCIAHHAKSDLIVGSTTLLFPIT